LKIVNLILTISITCPRYASISKPCRVFANCRVWKWL